jgi:hypothetical protein
VRQQYDPRLADAELIQWSGSHVRAAALAALFSTTALAQSVAGHAVSHINGQGAARDRRANKAQADLAERGHCDNVQRRRAGAPAGAAAGRGLVR